MKKALITAFAISLQISCAMAAPALVRTWDIDTTGQPAPAQYSAYHGESVEFVARLFGANRRPVALDEGWTAALMVSTNGVDYWRWDGASVSTGGVIRATWEPRMDCGADTYRCFIRAADPSDSNLIYRAAFALRLLDSPGFRPNELEPPVRTLDFATVDIANAPWIEEESDPTVPSWAKAETPPLTEESDPVWEAEKGAYATTNDVSRAIAAIEIPDPDLSFTNDYVKTESDPVWKAEKGAYASISQVAQATSLLARFSHWVMQWDELVTYVHPFDCVFDDAASPPQWAIAYAWSPDFGINYFDDAAYTGNTNREAVSVAATAYKPQLGDFTLSATRERLPGYILGNQDEKPVAGIGDMSAIATAGTNYTDAAVAGYAPIGHVHAASQITNALSTSQIPNLPASKITSGTLNAGRIPNLAASKITSGTFAADRIPEMPQYVKTNDVGTAAAEDVGFFVQASRKELHADGWTNVVWQNVYSNGWVFLRAYTNELSEAY